MSYQLLSVVKGWIANPLGECDSVKLTDAVNDIRQYFYSWYASLPIGLDVEECFAVQNFCHPECHRDPHCRSNKTFQGITLPKYVQTVEAMWYSQRPIELFDRWRIWQQGIIPNSAECGLSKFDLGYAFPTERDILPACPARVQLSVRSREDIGKRVKIRGITAGGEDFEESLELEGRPVETREKLIAITAPGGIAKEPTVGQIVVSTADTARRVLSVIDPEETVPAYTRIQITGLPSGCPQVAIRGSRRFTRLYDDFDVVETDNKAVWDNMARFLRLQQKMDRGQRDAVSAAGYLETAKQLMLGDLSRQTGKATAASVRFATPNINTHALRARRNRAL